MSDDPTTRSQIMALARDDRPLLVVDIDEVVLEFTAPFIRFLDSQGYDFVFDSFSLDGNVRRRSDGEAIADDDVADLVDRFFGVQNEWQTPVDGFDRALERLTGPIQVVLLTAMPHRYFDLRQGLVDRFGFADVPLLTTERAKGPAVSLLRGGRTAPVAFIDDMPHNHSSVRQAEPDATLIHLMASAQMRALMPELPGDIHLAEDWNEAANLVERHLLDR